MECLAHRGFAGVAPENTVEALRAASETASMVEFDVRRCGSGELVVVHDETVDRVTNGTGRVAELSYDELAALNVLGTGSGVPTLDDVIAAVPPSTGLNVELKERGLAADVTDALAGHDDPVLVSSFDETALSELRDVADLPRAFVFQGNADAGLRTARDLECGAVHPHWELCDSALVERAHRDGFTVNAWTIADETAARSARQAGVDGIFTDYPGFCEPIGE